MNYLYTLNAENLYKGAAWNLSKRDKGFFLFLLSNNFWFTSYKYIKFGYSKVHRPNLFDCDFYWWPRAKQTTNSNMI